MVDETKSTMLRCLLRANGVLERDREPVLFIDALKGCREILSAELYLPDSAPLSFDHKDSSSCGAGETAELREYTFGEAVTLTIKTHSELAAEIIGEFDLNLLLSASSVQTPLNNDLLLSEAEKVAGIGSWEYDITTGKFRISEGWQRMHGVEKPIFTHDELVTLIGSDDVEQSKQKFSIAVQEKDEFSRIKKLVVEGQEKWIECHAAVDRDADGNPTRVYGACIDITSARKQEEELHFQSLVLEQIQDLITATDMDGRITYVNNAVCQLLGKDSVDLLGETVATFGEDPAVFSQQQILDATKDGGFDGEVVNIAHDGRKVYLSVRTSLLRDREGNPIGMLGISTDVSEKRTTLDALRMSEENYRTLAENSFDLIMRFDRDFRIMYISPGMEKIWGRKVTGFKGMTLREAKLPAKMCDLLEMQIGRVFKTGQSVIEKYPIPMKAGRAVWECRMTPEGDADGNVASVITYAGDVTEIENIIQALEDSEKRYQTLFVMSPFGILVLKKHRYIMGNSAAAKTLGLESPERIAGTSPLDFIPDELKDNKDLQNFTYMLSEHPVEMKLKQADGNIIVTETTSIPISFDGEDAALIILQDITERKYAQESLRRNEIFLHAIFNSINEPITVMDRAMKIRHANDASKALHRDKLPLEGKMCIEVFDHIRCKECAVRGTFDTAQPQKIIKTNPDDGVIYQITTYPILDRDGTVEFVVEAMYDITERVQNENRIIESERRLREAQRIARLGTWEWDLEDDRVRLSETMQAILGIGSDPVVPPESFLLDTVHPDDYQSTVDFFDMVAEDKSPSITDFRVIASDESVLHLYCRATPVMNSNGQVSKVIGIVQDISIIKNIQLVLREKVNELQTILGSIPEAIVFTDLKRRVRQINSAFTRTFGLTPKDIVGKPISSFFESLDEYSRQERERYSPKAEPTLAPYEVLYRKKDGTIFPAETIGFPVTNAAGETTGFIGIIRDITERKMLEEDKTKLEKQLRRIQKLETIGTMAGGIAHDFNNLLSPILGYSELAATTISEDSPAQDYLNQIRKSADKARNLVKQILIFSRQVDQRRKPVYLDRSVEESLELLRSTLPKSIELKVSLERYTVFADPTEIHQIVVNFVTNSWHALPDEKGTIDLTIREANISRTHLKKLLPKGRYACMSIQDNGSGIPRMVQERIFEPFFTTKDLNRGTGLGLSVVHGLVQSLGGTITFESEENVGTRFDVYLPVMDNTVRREEQDVESPEKGSGKILVVDDERANTYLYQRLLTRSGYTVSCANDPVAALDMLDSIDLLLTDMTMPSMSGLDLVREIRGRGFEIPVIIMTGYSEKLTPDIVEEYGVFSILLKPLTTGELTSAIRTALEKS